MKELPIACERSELDEDERRRQKELWRRVAAEIEEVREIDDGYALKLPARLLADAAVLMDIERRCCGFLKLRLEAEASEPHVWFTLSGPPGTKQVLANELELMLGRDSL